MLRRRTPMTHGATAPATIRRPAGLNPTALRADLSRMRGGLRQSLNRDGLVEPPGLASQGQHPNPRRARTQTAVKATSGQVQDGVVGRLPRRLRALQDTGFRRLCQNRQARRPRAKQGGATSGATSEMGIIILTSPSHAMALVSL